MTSQSTISDWVKDAPKDKRWVVIMCDTFEYTEYPVYCNAEEALARKDSKGKENNMQTVMECYDTEMDLKAQLNTHRCLNWPSDSDYFGDYMNRLRASGAPMGSLQDLKDFLKRDIKKASTIYTFDDVDIGITTNDNKTVTQPLIHRPVGIKLEAWYTHAASVCALLNDMTNKVKGPGTVYWRFSRLMEELDKRFPGVVNHCLSDPPEPKYLAAIDELRSKHE